MAIGRKDMFRTEILDAADGREKMCEDAVLFFVLDGSMQVDVEGKISNLKQEDLLVVNAGRRVLVTAEEDVLYLQFSISYSLLSDALQRSDVYFWCDSSTSQNARYEDLRVLVRRMLNHYVETGGRAGSFGYLSDCYAIVNDLTANFMIQVEHRESAGDGDRYEDRLQEINHYIYTNYDQDISMKELSEKLYLSNGYLYRFFKKNYGMSFASYLSSVRVRHAADQLLSTDQSVTQIAYSCGFASAAVFNKAFRDTYGMTPSDYRKESQRPEKQKENAAHEEKIRKRLENILVSDRAEEKAPSDTKVVSGEYDAAVREPVKDYWGKIINFGAAANLLRSSVREQLMLLHQALGFEYVRFYNIFSRQLYIDPTKPGDYNFTQIDSILDFVLEQGMKPFIELGMKPDPIYYGLGHDRVDDEVTVTMDEVPLEIWKDLVGAFLRHLENRYGTAALDDWKMELWYDEEWRQEPEKNNLRYLAYFDAAWRLIRECNKNIAFGGYSIRMDTGEEERRKFLTLWSRQTARPDFISVMYYGYERGEDGLDRFARRNPDLGALARMLTKEKKLIGACGFADTPVIIDDWNLTPSVRNYINDTTFKAAYIVKNTIDVYGMVEAMGYGAGTDSMYPFYDTSEILFGGTGLMTGDGIMKPAAFAYEFLNHRLMPLYLGKSSNYLVTTDGHDSYAILCHNMQNLNYNYYLTGESELDKTSMWKYYEGRNRLNIRIRITDVTEGKYRIKLYRINEDHGNLLKIWGNLEYEKDPGRSDIKYLRRKCEPDLKIQTTETIGGAMMIEEQLKPNEIMIIRVHRIR